MDSDEVASIKKILVENWENAFHVSETGSEVDVYVEMENTDAKSDLWNHMPRRIKKKNIKIFKVPTGYIDVFIRNSDP